MDFLLKIIKIYQIIPIIILIEVFLKIRVIVVRIIYRKVKKSNIINNRVHLKIVITTIVQILIIIIILRIGGKLKEQIVVLWEERNLL